MTDQSQSSPVSANANGCGAQALRVVRQMLEAYDAGQLQMSSPDIGEPENDIPYHPWHEEMLHYARLAVSAVTPDAAATARTCATCHAVLADGPQPAATYDAAQSTPMSEVQFLLDRLEEFDPHDEDAGRDFNGHVVPAIERLRSALSSAEGK